LALTVLGWGRRFCGEVYHLVPSGLTVSVRTLSLGAVGVSTVGARGCLAQESREVALQSAGQPRGRFTGRIHMGGQEGMYHSGGQNHGDIRHCQLLESPGALGDLFGTGVRVAGASAFRLSSTTTLFFVLFIQP
jgi:hypothetical protein